MKITYDPNGAYPMYNPAELDRICGLVPYWVTDKRLMHLPLKDAIDLSYGFGLYEMDSTVDENHVMKYPGDPDLHPYMKIERGDEIYLQYPYAIIAIVGDSTFVTRVD